MSNLTHSEKKLFSLISEKQTQKFIRAYDTGQFINKFCSNAFGDSLLGFAIEKNAVGIANYLSEDSELINFSGKNGRPPSVYFKKHVDEAFLVNLIENGMDINACDSSQSTLLHNIARMGTYKDFQTAIEHGANARANNNVNEMPIGTAKRWHNKNILDITI